MTSVNYTLVQDEKGKSLSVYIDKDGDFKTHVLAESNTAFRPVLDHLLDNDPEDYNVDWIEAQVDILNVVGTRLNAVSERVRVTDTALLFDGDQVRNEIADHIVRLVREGDEAGYKPLVAFLEKTKTNPDPASIESLYAWIRNKQITIHQDGDLIAYKGVRVDAEGNSESIHSGKAIVNGVVQTGYIPNPDGAVVEMPRSQVQTDTGIGCASGLHAGNWRYASDFSQGRVLVVKINPRDVVSVPSDSSFEKLRVARYVVLSTIEQEHTAPTYVEDDDEYEDDIYEEDDYWGDGDDEYDY